MNYALSSTLSNLVSTDQNVQICSGRAEDIVCLSDLLKPILKPYASDNEIIIKSSEINEIIIQPYHFNGYSVLHPMSVSIELVSDDEVVATFEEAGIAISASSLTEAIQIIKTEVIELYEILKSEEFLGPEPKRQLVILENYIGKKRR